MAFSNNPYTYPQPFFDLLNTSIPLPPPYTYRTYAKAHYERQRILAFRASIPRTHLLYAEAQCLTTTLTAPHITTRPSPLSERRTLTILRTRAASPEWSSPQATPPPPIPTPPTPPTSNHTQDPSLKTDPALAAYFAEAEAQLRQALSKAILINTMKSPTLPPNPEDLLPFTKALLPTWSPSEEILDLLAALTQHP